MTVYVDAPQHAYGRMIMCHMLADTDAELHAMAQKLQLQRRWHQKAGTAHSHYDICKAKRRLAIQYGAVEITRWQLAALLKREKF